MSLHFLIDLCSPCEGTGEAAGPEESAGAAESAGGIQECPLSATGPETTPTR